MTEIINLVRRPILREGDTSSSAWTLNRTPATEAPVGGRDRRGNPLIGLRVGSTGNSVNTDLDVDADDIQPGDTLYFEMTTYSADANGIFAWISRNRTAEGGDTDEQEPDLTVEGNRASAVMIVPQGDGLLWLSLWAYPNDKQVQAVRVSKIDPDSEPDDLGIFDGDTQDTEEYTFTWTGTPYDSATVAAPVAAPGEPDDTGNGEPGEPGEPEKPEYGQTVTRIAQRVQRYLDDIDVELSVIAEHVEVVLAYVYGYTRGRGFKVVDVEIDGNIIAELEPKTEIESVIVAATGRLTPNPEQLSYYATGDYSERPAVLAGWTLLERAVLNNYRRTWA